MQPLAVWLTLTAGLSTLSVLATAANPSGPMLEDNLLLKRLFDADQEDRRGKVIDAETANRDTQRRVRVMQELRSGRIRTAEDHYHAAMVFQHGESADDIRLAFSLAWISAQMDPSQEGRARWLSAAAWDRIMMRLDKPQWYGTQYIAADASSEFRLYKIDETAVTDEQRKQFHVPTLEQAKKRVELLNSKIRNKLDKPRPNG